ncbi:hypothetical protein RCL1_002313 [Eukaryota sp. TZLM3-RCL]
MTTSLIPLYFLSFEEEFPLRPKFLQHEVALKTQKNVKLYIGDSDKPAFTLGHFFLTSHRILYFTQDSSTKLSIPLAQISSFELTKGFLFRHAKIILKVKPLPTPTPSTHPPLTIRYSFQEGGSSDSFSLLQRALSDQSWIITSSFSKPTSLSGVGVAAAKNMVHMERDQARQVMTNIEDLEALQKHANELTSLATRLSRSVNEAKSQENSSENLIDDAETRVNGVLNSLGLSVVASRNNLSNSEFYIALARDITTVLKPILTSKSNNSLKNFTGVFVGDWGGLIGLHDGFCLVNRARSTDLVSPCDFLQACQLLEDLSTGLTLYTLPSGSKAIITGRGISGANQMIQSHFERVSQSPGLDWSVKVKGKVFVGLSVVEIATSLELAVGITKDLIVGLERESVLVRDESTNGVLYFLNAFLV